MPSIDIKSLLQPISPVAPSGVNLEYDPAYTELEKKSRGTPEDPFTQQPAQPPKWEIIHKESESLLTRSRDIRLILLLTRSLLNTHGFAGLKDGLTVMQGALLEFWDSIHPQLDPEDNLDPTLRVNLLQELCDFDRFLRPISLIPIVESRSIGRFNYRDLQIATERIPVPKDGSKIELTTVQAAFKDSSSANLKLGLQTIQECIALLASIEDAVTRQVGIHQAPNLEAVRNLLKDVTHTFQSVAAGANVNLSDDDAAGTGIGDETNTAPAPAESLTTSRIATRSGEISSRQDVIDTLDKICQYYKAREPSSPIPILLGRAKRLVNLDFMEILKDLAPSGLSEAETIRGPEPGDES